MTKQINSISKRGRIAVTCLMLIIIVIAVGVTIKEVGLI